MSIYRPYDPNLWDDRQAVIKIIKEMRSGKSYDHFKNKFFDPNKQREYDSISDDNKIMLRINPSLSSFKYNEDDTRQSTAIREIAPDTVQKKLSTVVQVNSGDTIVLGGLIAQSKGKDNSKVPFLGDIPVLGNAFKSTKDSLRTTELVFIITPRIVDISNPTPINQSLKDLGFSRSIYER